jgi:cytoskeleton protein RodZ
MPDIGSILRETRIREKIDITRVEDATKIRAKYLRALENEEWAVLPGPSYIKSFLRTYAEFLGLDAHMLVEEYRARFERPEQLELPAFAHNRPLRGRVRPPGPPSRAGAIVALAVALLGVLFVLGITNDEKKPTADKSAAGSEKGRRHEARQANPVTPAAPAARRGKVSVAVVPERPVWVCLVDVRGRRLIGGRTLSAGKRAGPFSSTRFEITVGNGGGDFTVNGKLRPVPDRSRPLGYAISPSGVRLLPESRQPTCGPEPSGTGSP